MILRVAAFSALTFVGALGAATPSAEAGTAYRYWSYWNAGVDSSQWRYATEGSGTYVPVDGQVEGWRFGIAGDSLLIQPAPSPDFETICVGVELPEGGKRIAVVIDPGGAQEAPPGEKPGAPLTECVTTDAASTGLQVLQSLADVRMESGFVCGIGGYPANECAPLVELPDSPPSQIDALDDAQDMTTAASQTTTNESSVGTPLITAATVSVLALVGFSLWRYRRRQEP